MNENTEILNRIMTVIEELLLEGSWDCKTYDGYNLSVDKENKELLKVCQYGSSWRP